jgi:hypothetical protein
MWVHLETKYRTGKTMKMSLILQCEIIAEILQNMSLRMIKLMNRVKTAKLRSPRHTIRESENID